MSTVHTIQTVLEIVMIGLIVLGIIYEPVLAKWEDKQKERILKAFNERKRYRRWGTLVNTARAKQTTKRFVILAKIKSQYCKG